MCWVGRNLQSTTFHKNHLQQAKALACLIDTLWGSLTLLYFFKRTKPGHLLKTFSPAEDAIILSLSLSSKRAQNRPLLPHAPVGPP